MVPLRRVRDYLAQIAHAQYESVLAAEGKDAAEIHQVHEQMIRDYDESVADIVYGQKKSAEYAIMFSTDFFTEMFEMMDSDYMKQRAADMIDIRDQYMELLLDIHEEAASEEETKETEEGSEEYTDDDERILYLQEDMLVSLSNSVSLITPAHALLAREIAEKTYALVFDADAITKSLFGETEVTREEKKAVLRLIDISVAQADNVPLIVKGHIAQETPLYAAFAEMGVCGLLVPADQMDELSAFVNDMITDWRH